MDRIFRWHRQDRRLRRLALAIFISIFVCSESADWMACNIAADSGRGKSCAVLVLGYPSASDGKPNRVQEVRVAAGLRGYRHYRCDRLVFSGAAVQNQIVEAQTMAQLARDSGVRSDRISLETQARNTWENIKFSIPLVAPFDRILIASDSLHAQRGRRYLCKQRPDLCDRTFVAVAYQLNGRWWWKMLSAGNELFAWGRDLLLF